MSSRWAAENAPALPSSLIVSSPADNIVVANPPSIKCRLMLSGSSILLFGGDGAVNIGAVVASIGITRYPVPMKWCRIPQPTNRHR